MSIGNSCNDDERDGDPSEQQLNRFRAMENKQKKTVHVQIF